MKNTIIKVIGTLCIMFILVIMLIMVANAGGIGGATGVGEFGVGPCPSSAIAGWKVSLYVGKADKFVDYYSPIDDFDFKGMRIFYNPDHNIASDNNNTLTIRNLATKTMYVGTSNKVEYVRQYNNHQDLTLSTRAIAKTNNNTDGDGFIVCYDIDDVRYNPKDNVNVQAQNDTNNNMIANFNNPDWAYYKIVKRLNQSIDKNDQWIIIWEPLQAAIDNGMWSKGGSINSGNIYCLTATEYAIAQRQWDLGVRGANSYNSIDKRWYKNAQGQYVSQSSQRYTIKNLSDFVYVSDSRWFGFMNHTEQYRLINGEYGKEEYLSKTQFRDECFENILYLGGAGFTFSESFKLPNYTVSVDDSSERWENENITIGATVHNSNPAQGGDVNVVLNYDGKNYSQTAHLSGEKSAYVSWSNLPNKYNKGDAGGSVKKYSVEIRSDNNSEINTDDNQTDVKEITLKRDFSVVEVKLDKTEVFENEDITATFTVKNNNPYMAYDDVKVDVYFKDEVISPTHISTVTLSLAAGGTKTCTVPINVGSVQENKNQKCLVAAVINANYNLTGHKSWHESDLSNNRNNEHNQASKVLGVKRIIDLAVKIVTPNASFSDNIACIEGSGGATDVITSCLVYNMSRFNLYRSDKMNDTITVSLYANGTKVGEKQVDVPANSSNLVWFKWKAPRTAGEVTLEARLTWNVNQEYTNGNDNTSSCKVTVNHVDKFSTPDTALAKEKAKDYSKSTDIKLKTPTIARWSFYSYENGGFVKYKYAVTTKPTAKLSPMVMPKEDDAYANGSNFLAGSGFSMTFSYNYIGEYKKNNEAVATSFSPNGTENYLTYMQNATAGFPEFQYKRSAGNCRTLYFNGGVNSKSLRLAINEKSDPAPGQTQKQRVHFTPVNMPDGLYSVSALGYDLWTPAGMIYVNASPAINITDSVYNEHYVS